MEVWVYTDFRLKPGDWVAVESEQKPVLFGLFMLFIFPLILPVVAYLLAMKSGFGVWFAIAGAVIAVALIWLLSKSRWFLERTKPKVISVISGKR